MIFGEENLTTVDVSMHKFFSNKTETTHHDRALNYVIGSIILVAALASIILNPLCAYLHYLQAKSTGRTLFLVLATSDFLTNLYHPWVCVKNFLKTDIGPPVRNAQLHEQVDTVVFRTLTWSSLIATCLLSLCRFIKLTFPFHKTRSRNWILAHLLYCLLIFCFFFDMAIGFGYYDAQALWFRYCQMTWRHYIIAYDVRIIIPMMVTMSFTTGVGITCSLASILLLLYKHYQGEGNAQLLRSSAAIAIMNIGNFIFVVFQVLYAIRKASDPVVNFLAMGAFPILLSAFNPAVIMLLSTSLKSTLKRQATSAMSISLHKISSKEKKSFKSNSR